MNKKQLIALGDRAAGLIAVAFGGGVAIALNLKGLDNVASAIAVDSCGGILTAIGLSDLISGQSMYLPEKIGDYINERRNIRYLL